MTVLVIAEHDSEGLKSSTLNVIGAASALEGPVEVLVAGHDCTAAANSAASIQGVSKVIHADHPCYQHQLPEALAPLVAELGRGYNYILAAAGTSGKNLLPRAAALLDVSPISDVVKIAGADTFVRPIYAGNALATVQSSDAIKILSLRISAFSEAKQGAEPAAIESCSLVHEQSLSTYQGESLVQSERPDLSAASIVISGGRGMQSSDNFKILERIADKLGAAVGASRAAVDAGYVSNDLQVGQTGKVVAPDLYVAVGISGAIQHLAGMKDSRIIVAINKDPDAPIFQVADYGLVADLFQVLPEIESLL